MCLYYILTFSLFLIPSVFAVDNVTSPTTKLPNANATNITDGWFIAGVIRYGIILTSILAAIGVTWAAISMILAHGDENKFKTAKNNLIYTLVGVGVAGLAYTIVKIITNLNL